jgi:sn-glycerol 3-phosphate transport system substrate-binding protein
MKTADGSRPGSLTRRQVVARSAGGAVALGLAACGPGAGAGPDTTRSKAPVKFSFWNVRAFGPMEEKLISIYQEKNPHVTVEYVEAAKQGITGANGSSEEVAALVVRATAGGAVDVAKVEASRSPFGLWAKKAIAGLNKYGGDKAAANLLNTELMQFAGNTWGLTYEASVRGLSYSGAAFKAAGLDPDKPPQTWQQVIEQGQRLTTGRRPAEPERQSQQPAIDQGQQPAMAADKYAYIFPINNFLKTLDQVWMNGGEVVDRTYLPTKATFTQPKVMEVYQFQYDLVHKYGISPDRTLSNPNLGGLVAMSYDDASNIPTWRARQPEADWRMARMFRQRLENPCHSGAAGSSLVLFNSSEAPEAAAEYMKWLVSEEVQRIHALITPVGLTMEQVGSVGIFPGHKKVASDPYWDTNPLVKGMNNCVGGIKVAPLSPVWAEVNTILSQANVDMMGGKVSVRDGLTEANRQVQALLDEDQQNNRDLYATAK